MRHAVIDLPSQPIRNRNVNPSLAVAGQGWASNDANLYAVTRLTTGGPDGGPCFQVTRTASTPANNIIASFYTFGYSGSILQLKVTPGELLQCSLAVKVSDTNRKASVQMTFRDAAGASVAAQVGGVNTNLTPNVWTRVSSQVVTVPAGADSVLMGCQVTTVDLTDAPAGAIALFDQAFIGAPHSVYADGDTPGWRWTGTPGASQSVGYPYTLESIAGRPLKSLIGAGAVAVPTLPPFQGRTLYAVYSAVDSSNNFQVITSISGGALGTSGGMRIQTNGTGVNTVASRVDLANGSSNATASMGSRDPGVHVASLTVNDGATIMRSLAETGVENSRTGLTPGDGFPLPTNPQLTNVAAANIAAVASFYYGEEHNLTTRNRIIAWLARQYGAAVPVGY